MEQHKEVTHAENSNERGKAAIERSQLGRAQPAACRADAQPAGAARAADHPADALGLDLPADQFAGDLADDQVLERILLVASLAAMNARFCLRYLKEAGQDLSDHIIGTGARREGLQRMELKFERCRIGIEQAIAFLPSTVIVQADVLVSMRGAEEYDAFAEEEREPC